MNNPLNNQHKKLKKELSKKIGIKEKRKLKKQNEGGRASVWFGLGMFGLVGWSVAIPTLLFLAIGIWIDAAHPGKIAWTLIFLFIGVVLGCFNAWYWVQRESKYDRSRTR